MNGKPGGGRSVVAFVSGGDGEVNEQSPASEALFGTAEGVQCKDLLAVVSPVHAPCSTGCVEHLLEGGCGAAVTSDIGINGRMYKMTCVPTDKHIVTTLIGGPGEETSWEKLSPREVDMLFGLADGLTTKEMADEYGVKPATVRAHVEHMRLKFGVSTRAGLVARGFQLGYLS